VEGRNYILLATSPLDAECWINHLKPCSSIHAENEIIRKADILLRDSEREKCVPNKKKDKIIKLEISGLISQISSNKSDMNLPFLNSVVPQEINETYKLQNKKNGL
jgi:hypothetical protein